jgi:hypothetical protein
MKMACSLGVRAMLEASDELYRISAATGGEAMPQPLCQVDTEGGGIVTAVERAWPMKLIPTACELGVQAIG